ncbi:MAG: restriction endonuclease subunit S [Bacteroidetes bacterium]|nr:restriction endonuclease subunit S [Bacteroidota bacterium]
MEATATKATVQKYPVYQDSGEYWMGLIPKHWELKKLKHVFQEKKKVTNPELPCGSISYGKVVYKDDEKIPESTKASYQEVLAGEFLINPLNLNYDLLSLRIGLSQINVVVSSGYIVLKNVIELDKSYFNYLLHRYDVAYMKLLGSGVRQTISFNHIANSLLAFPPLPEQTAIAKFLNDKTAKIDRAISQKEKMIALLKEHKQIIIQDAVTKGLDPNAKMKHSGVEWIGEIPEHYSITKLGLCLKPVSIKNQPELPLLSITRELGVIVRDTDDQEANHNFIPDDLSGYKVIKAGQFGMNKMKAWQGSYGVSKFDGIVSPAYYVFDLISDINPDFFHLAIRSKIYVPFFAAASDGVRIGQWDLNKSRMKEIPLVIPPIEEQLKAIVFIGNQSEKIESAIAKQELQIVKLKELKSTLIDSAVTGKIKVS